MSTPFSNLLNFSRQQIGRVEHPEAGQTQSGLLIVGEVPAMDPDPEPTGPPPPPYVEPELTISFVDDTHEAKDLVHINHEANVLTAWFSEYAVNIQFNEEFYKAHVWNKGFDYTAVDGLFSYDIDQGRIPTCKFYAPSQQSLDDGAVEHPDYAYYNNVDAPVCLNKDLAKSSNWFGTVHSVCPHTVQNGCDHYEASAWIVTHSASVDGTNYEIQQNFLSDRRLTYRIVSVTGDSRNIHSSVVIRSDADIEAIIGDFNELTGGLPVTVHEVSLNPSIQPVQVSFLSTLVSVGE